MSYDLGSIYNSFVANDLNGILIIILFAVLIFSLWRVLSGQIDHR